MNKLLEIDIWLLKQINSINIPSLNIFMAGISEKQTWYPIYIGIIVCLFIKYRKKAYWPILGIICAVGLSDQICSGILKPLTARLRPCHTPGLQHELINLVDCVGLYSFCSSHAALSFAIAHSVVRWSKGLYGIKLFYVWAALIALSRVYLGVHFPSDILAGSVIGLFVAEMCFSLQKRINPNIF
jgi:undecaprenyl-diphosphatase